MKLLIAVPSKGRAVQFAQFTGSWLHKVDGIERAVFVERDEVESYWAHSLIPVVGIEQHNLGLGMTNRYIKEFAKAHKFDLIFKIDDDLMGWVGKTRKFSDTLNPFVFQMLLDDCVKIFDQYPQVGGISFPYSFQMFELKKWVGVNQRFQTCYLVRTDSMLDDPRISAFEDFGNFLNIVLKKQQVVLRYGYAGMHCLPVGEGLGGHQSFDRKARFEQEAAALREIHPGLQFKRVEGKGWTYEPDLRDPILRPPKIK